MIVDAERISITQRRANIRPRGVQHRDVSMRGAEIGDDRLVASAGAPIEVHAYVEVLDLDQALGFDVGRLGLYELRRFRPRWVKLAGARNPSICRYGLEPEFRAGSVTLRRDCVQHGTPLHLDFVVDDLPETAVERAWLTATSVRQEPQRT